MIEEGKIILKFNINFKRQMIIVEDDKVSAMSYAEFFQCYFSSKRIGVIESDFTYSTFDELIEKSISLKVGTSQMATYISDDGINIIRFIFQKNEDDSAYCEIYKVQLINSNKDQLSRDYLTGVLSRGSLIKECENAMRNMISNDYLIVIDLDNFKIANDTLGHIAGDTYLKNIAGMINNIGKDQIVGRYGGDEFVLYLRNISKEYLMDIVEKILDIRLDYSEGKNLAQIVVTCSLGITKIEEGEFKMSTAFERADHALYKAKHMGKNTAYFSTGEFYSHRNQQKNNLKKKVQKNNKKLPRKNSRLFRKELRSKKIFNSVFALAALLILIVFSMVISSFYSKSFEERTKNEAHTVMQDISSQIESNILSNINNWIGQLKVTENIISNIDTDASNANYLLSQALTVLEQQIDGCSVSLLLESGDLYYRDGIEYNVSSSELADYVIARDEEYIGTYYINYVGERIVFAIPFGEHQIQFNVFNDDNTKIAGIVGLLPIENFAKILNSTAFSGTPYFSLVKKDGTIIVNSASSELVTDVFHGTNNIFNAWDNYNGKDSTNEIITNFEQKNNGVSNITIDYIEYISFYSPVLIGDWYLFITVPSSVVLNDIVQAFNFTEVVINSLFVLISIIIFILTTLFNRLRTKMQTLTYIDPITKDINYERFKIDAEKLLFQDSENTYCIVYLNIKHFKFLVENLGQNESNDVLKDVFEIIENELTPMELVCHVISDRFAILMNEFDENIIKKRLINISNKIKDKINTNYLFEIVVTQGVYKITDSKSNIAVYTDRAHVAQMAIKDFYSNDGINFFDETWEETDAMTFDIEHKQDNALKENQFHVYYQMKKNIKDDTWYGAEALVRWIDPIHGMILPGVFIPLFEKNGFVIKVDLYVFERVCQDLNEILSLGGKPLRISVNVSRSHLLHNNFLNQYFDIMRKYNISPDLVEFELTESMAYESKNILICVINEIHKFGSTCSIDDFGSGYSSLNMLKEFDFDVIKLDQAFFKGRNGFDDKEKTIVASIINLCHELGKQVVAEGVEDISQVEFLKKNNCDAIQGFYYSKPEPFTEYKYNLDKNNK